MREAASPLLIGVAAAALVIDQASKGIVRRKLDIDDTVCWAPVLHLHRRENRGRGWLRIPTPWAVLLLLAIAAAGLAATFVLQVGVC